MTSMCNSETRIVLLLESHSLGNNLTFCHAPHRGNDEKNKSRSIFFLTSNFCTLMLLIVLVHRNNITDTRMDARGSCLPTILAYNYFPFTKKQFVCISKIIIIRLFLPYIYIYIKKNYTYIPIYILVAFGST